VRLSEYVDTLGVTDPAHIAPLCHLCGCPKSPYASDFPARDLGDALALICCGCGDVRQGSRLQVMAAWIGYHFHENSILAEGIAS
jgi:hypothetical protein